MQIEVSFLGGASSIGASCTLVRVGDVALVVDCGIRYSGGSNLPDLAALADVPVDAVLVTHAHMDHSGGLPVVTQACPGAPVFATPPTIDLVSILLRDALRLMNGPERESEVPLYSEHHVEQLLSVIRPVPYHQAIRVRDIEIRWLPAAHILGAAMIQLQTPAGTVLFTGDYSVTAQHTVPALSRPDFLADLVISESTYGERLHEDRNAAEQRLLSQVNEVVARGGRVLIPAFAVGRAQEVLLILKHAQRNRTLPEVPVFVDGMVRAVCGVYSQHPSYVSRHLTHEIRRAPHPFFTDTIQPVLRPQDRQRVLATSPCIIVASSGMLSGGPSALYARELAPQANDAIVLTGYQDEESPGRALLELARSEGPRELKLGQLAVPVSCSFGTYGLSAHADRMQMVSLIEAARPRTVALVHGDESAKQALARSLSCQDVILAQDGTSLRRAYRARHRTQAPAVPMPDTADLDIPRIRHLLGPPGSAPVRAALVAEAWFGQPVDRTNADRFARVLESIGLVRRDDHHRDRLWVLAPTDTHLFPDEAELEVELKRTNPKGRLLELCMRLRIDPPQVELKPQGAYFQATMSLDLHGQELHSGIHQAASKKSAEQLAARALLELVTEQTTDVPATPVSEDDVLRLQATNPKGRLLEWCARNRQPAPQFEQQPIAGGYRARVVLDLVGQPTRSSQWCSASTLKVAEQAAADDLLTQLSADPVTVTACEQAGPARSTDTPAAAITHSNRNAAMRLNELRQVGVLKDISYEVLQQKGPSHQPTFAVVAQAVLPDRNTLTTEPVWAASKKAGQRAAAEQLLDLLIEQQITGD